MQPGGSEGGNERDARDLDTQSLTAAQYDGSRNICVTLCARVAHLRFATGGLGDGWSERRMLIAYDACHVRR